MQWEGRGDAISALLWGNTGSSWVINSSAILAMVVKTTCRHLVALLSETVPTRTGVNTPFAVHGGIGVHHGPDRVTVSQAGWS